MAYDDRFWNSESGDRIYDAEEWDYYAESIASDGYVPDSAHLNGGLWVRQADPADMSVNVDTGHMWINGKHFRVHTSAENLAVAAADSSNDRIDRAIVRVNRTNRVVFPTVKTGTAGTSPSPPSLQQDSSIWELSLAQIYVAAGVTSVSDTDITDERAPSHSMPEPAEHGSPSHDGSVADNPHGHGSHSIGAEEYITHLADDSLTESDGVRSYPYGTSIMGVNSSNTNWPSINVPSTIITHRGITHNNAWTLQWAVESSGGTVMYWRGRDGNASNFWGPWHQPADQAALDSHNTQHEPFGADYVSYQLANDYQSIDATASSWPDGATTMYSSDTAVNPGGILGSVLTATTGDGVAHQLFWGRYKNRQWVRNWDNNNSVWQPWRELVDTVSITQIGRNAIASDSNHTLALDDAGKVVLMRADTMDVTVTVPADGTVNFPVGTVIEILDWSGGGSTIISPASGVTLRSPYGQTGTRQIFGQYATATLRKEGTDDWVLGGDLE